MKTIYEIWRQGQRLGFVTSFERALAITRNGDRIVSVGCETTHPVMVRTSGGVVCLKS